MILLRRRLLAAGLALPFADALAQSCTRTPSQTEGPFFKTDTPLRASFLEKDSPGRLVVSGQVLSARCQPVPNALLEFWHADEFGEYDNKGYRYRGHQHADAQGRYRISIEAGTYTVFCSLPGHAEAGMVGTLRVAP